MDRFVRVEREVVEWLAAADPRVALRARQAMPEDTAERQEILKRIGTEAVLAEDATATIRGGSLDLFAFRARARALDKAAETLSAFHEALPETGAEGSALDRPRLERELLGRLIDEERARARDEAGLVDSAGDLVRGILATWTAPATPQEWPERDAWVSRHLLEIRGSIRSDTRPAGPSDLDSALYPLERLLAPLSLPKGAAAVAEVRMALDDPRRPIAPLIDAARIAASVAEHDGIAIDENAMPRRLARIEEPLRAMALQALDASPERTATLERASHLLLVESPCPEVSRTIVRAMAPPPERAAICGILRALTSTSDAAAALVALHDDILFAFSSVTTAPPARTALLTTLENDVVDALRRSARERPVVFVGVALAAEFLYGSPGGDARLREWAALGEIPEDVVARETSGARRESR